MRDLPDEPPGVPPTNLKVAEIAGNHVVLDLGGGRYAMYAHFAPHSVSCTWAITCVPGTSLVCWATAGTRPVRICIFRSATGRPRWM